MKWIGSLLFIIATTAIGYFFSLRLSERPQQIRSLIYSLQVMEAEMTYNQLPLHQLFHIVGNKVGSPLQQFYRSLATQLRGEVNNFSKLWTDEVRYLIEHSSLQAKEADILNQFGKNLGQYSIKQQQKHIQLTIIHLNRELEEANYERDKYEKLSRNIGFLFGLFIVIIFI